MFALTKKIYSLLDPDEKKSLWGLFFQAILNALFQTFSVISIFPFIAIVASPGLIQTNKYLSWLYQFFNSQSIPSFLMVLGSIILLLIIVSNFSFILMLRQQKKFIKKFHVNLGAKLLKLYLSQDYIFFVQNNSSDLSKRVLEDARFIAEKLMISILDFMVSAIMSLSLLAMIIYVDPILTLFVMAFIGLFYGAVFLFTKKSIHRLSYEKNDSLKGRHKAISETFGAAKEIKLSHLENLFTKNFVSIDERFAETISKLTLYTKVPSYALDVITFGGLMLIILYFLYTNGNINSALPILTLYALSAHRLKPQVQLMFSSVANFNFSRSALEVILNDFNTLKTDNTFDYNEDISFKNFSNISLKDLNYQYPSGVYNVINDLNLNIDSNKTIALVGHSGSGKTTLVDLILGILKPKSGEMYVDGIEINDKNIRDWQKVIGYIPQHIFLFDDTIQNNITLDKTNSADPDKVKRVIQMAGLAEFVEQAPKGINTIVGDKGVKLSGGQRQRIGIARALYKEPSLLIMDEGTSALDGITEDRVMNSIYELSGTITIIIIAHRLTTIRNCDVIHFMDKGRITQSGIYNELIETNPDFSKMAKENPTTTVSQN